MIFQTLLTPVTSIRILGWPVLCSYIFCGADVGLMLGIGVEQGGLAEVLSLVWALLLAALWLAQILACTLWRNVESYFDTMPWLHHTQELQANKGGRTYQTKCPFTGLRPTVRCPSCSCRVHDLVLGPADKWVEHLPVCDVPLRWEAAKAALDNATDPIKAREELDRALDFRGNTALCGVTSACVGCQTWQRYCHLHPRLALGLASVAVTSAILPWAFGSFVTTLGSAGVPVQVVLEAVGVYYATLAVLLQVQALLKLNEFMTTYRLAIPEFKPLFTIPGRGPLRWAADLFLVSPWATAG